MKVKILERTHIGKAQINQDSIYKKMFVISGVFVAIIAVADGMGGYSDGEWASKTAISELDNWFTAFAKKSQVFSYNELDEGISDVFEKANNKIVSKNKSEKKSSGTTLTVCAIINDLIMVKNLGDTRCYICANGNLNLLSEDHSWIKREIDAGRITEAEAKTHKNRNAITKCVGMGESHQPTTYKGNLKNEQTICVCSDGFYKRLTEGEIIEFISTWVNDNTDISDTVLGLLDERNEKDNISFIFLRVYF